MLSFYFSKLITFLISFSMRRKREKSEKIYYSIYDMKFKFDINILNESYSQEIY